MSHEKKVNLKNLPKVVQINKGDFILVETAKDGTKILDFTNFAVDETNTTFSPLLSTLRSDTDSISAALVPLPVQLDALNTLVTEVSGLTGLDWRYDWSGSSTYNVLDGVFYEKSAFVAKSTSTNQAPLVGDVLNSSYWGYLAKGSVPSLSAYGDLLVGDGAGSSKRLAGGTSGYVLKSQGGANDLIWAQQDTGRPGCVVDDLPYFNRTSAETRFAIHFLMANDTVKAGGEGYGIGTGYQFGYTYYMDRPTSVNMPSDYDYQSADSKIRKIVKGPAVTFLIAVNGDVYGTGHNDDGQVGVGDTTDRNSFVKISFPDSGVKIRDIVHATDNTDTSPSTYFLTENDGSTYNDGRAYACGNNGGGELGDGTTTDRSSPIRVGTLINIDKLWAYTGATGTGSPNNTAFARLTNGNFYGWGENGGYNLGNNSTTDIAVPTHQTAAISFTPGDATSTGLHGVQDVVVNGGLDGGSTYYSSVTVLLTSGHVYYTGENGNYGAGNNSTTDLQQWTLVSGVSAVQSIAVHPGYTTSSTLAVCSAIDGGEWNQTTHKYENFTDYTSTSGQLVVGWGINSYGHLGDGTTTSIQKATRLSNNYWPSALAPAVSSVHVAAHHWGNLGIWTYIRDLSGYYWFCGRRGGQDLNNQGQWDGVMHDNSNASGVTTPVKMALPCHPSEIKRFLPVAQDYNSGYPRGNVYILTHDGRVFISGSYTSYMGAGIMQGAAEAAQANQWIQYSF